MIAYHMDLVGMDPFRNEKERRKEGKRALDRFYEKHIQKNIQLPPHLIGPWISAVGVRNF
jgi:hypothetical protein